MLPKALLAGVAAAIGCTLRRKAGGSSLRALHGRKDHSRAPELALALRVRLIGVGVHSLSLLEARAQTTCL